MSAQRRRPTPVPAAAWLTVLRPHASSARERCLQQRAGCARCRTPARRSRCCPASPRYRLLPSAMPRAHRNGNAAPVGDAAPPRASAASSARSAHGPRGCPLGGERPRTLAQRVRMQGDAVASVPVAVNKSSSGEQSAPAPRRPRASQHPPRARTRAMVREGLPNSSSASPARSAPARTPAFRRRGVVQINLLRHFLHPPGFRLFLCMAVGLSFCAQPVA